MQNPIKEKYQLFIGGEWVDGIDGKTYETHNPSTGEVLSTCVQAGEKDVDRAVEAAWKAYATWKESTLQERSAILGKIADVLENHAEHLGLVESLDQGMSVVNAQHMVMPFTALHFRYFSNVIAGRQDKASVVDKDVLNLNLSEPFGVVGQIIPWNMPMISVAWKIAPALAAGNTVVLKPSSETSLSCLELMKLLEGILPPGVVNVVTGGGTTTGRYIINHPGIRKLTFTGSTDVGYEVAEAAAKNLIPATLELGGKSGIIVFPDCNWEKAVEGASLGILFNSGQACAAGSRVLVHESIYDKFLADCVDVFERVKVGLPTDPETQLTAVASKTQMNKILEYFEIGKKEGAKIACGGYRVTENGLENGYFIKPTIFADVDNKMRIAQEEIFGPVVCFIKFKDEAEAIRLADDTQYGLAAGVWTQDINRAIRVSKAMESGTVWVNCAIKVPLGSGFGGYKKSGYGRENYADTIEAYVQNKSVVIDTGESPLGLYPKDGNKSTYRIS